MIVEMCTESPESWRIAARKGADGGLIAERTGARAIQIGPSLAHGDAGRWLLLDAQRRLAGQLVYIDVPLPNRKAVAVVERMGLTVHAHVPPNDSRRAGERTGGGHLGHIGSGERLT